MDLQQQTVAKLVLLGEMGSGKSSLVLRYVKGQFFDYQVSDMTEQQHWPYLKVLSVIPRSSVLQLPVTSAKGSFLDIRRPQQLVQLF